MELRDVNNVLVRSKQLLKSGPLLLSFIQGDWSEFDKIELKALKKSYVNFLSRGVHVIVITPLSPSKNQKLSNKLKLPCMLLSDVDFKISTKFGLVYEAKHILEADHHPSSSSSSSGSATAATSLKLVIPATYMINQKKKVEYAHVNVDPTSRVDPKRLLRIAPTPVLSSGIFGRKPRAPGIFSIKKMGWTPFRGKGIFSASATRTIKSYDGGAGCVLNDGNSSISSSSKSRTTNQSTKSEPPTNLILSKKAAFAA